MRVVEPAVSPELVLGLPRARLMGDGGWQGVLYGDVAPYLDLIAEEATYRPRPDAEHDPSWKQVIPYLALRDRGRLFLMRRTRAGGDARLHDRWSIGVGGHVHPVDGDPVAGLLREWREELDAEWLPEPQPLGLLNDDSTPVGRVHIGLIYVADRKSTRLNSSHVAISYAVFCLKKKNLCSVNRDQYADRSLHDCFLGSKVH